MNPLSISNRDKRDILYDEIMRVLRKSPLPDRDKAFILQICRHKIREKMVGGGKNKI